ncbi:repressor of the inhibitor of the protein kinase [Trichonephila clavata]|uniref:Repressor of the inhibitor of the protein kinase n=1 Tax=Trichonephila clavata TaxID=2740835 RepID=A0A8X6IUI9_TRICU|nr:repressor of the inhibitor of the protein kinase [Trichonephila clavata]
MPLSAVQAEYKLWCAKISSTDPSTEILKLFEYCDGTFFRAMNLLLKVMATLPVTTASVERSFSTMKRIKTLPRSVIGEDRLNALAMMSIHWDTVVDPEEVLDRLAKKKIKKVTFLRCMFWRKINTDMNFAISSQIYQFPAKKFFKLIASSGVMSWEEAGNFTSTIALSTKPLG